MRASQGYDDGTSTSEGADTDDDAIFEMELEPAGPALAVPMRQASQVIYYCCVSSILVGRHSSEANTLLSQVSQKTSTR